MRPLVIAHRGASFDLPENTLPAFERAIEVGADFIEFDVHANEHGGRHTVHRSRSRYVHRVRSGEPRRQSPGFGASQTCDDSSTARSARGPALTLRA